MKKVLGLDLGTTSIGWAIVNQSENENEQSSIIDAGVRINPLTSDEKDAFEKGKDITTNSERRLRRSMRRNIDRYQLRRSSLIETMKSHGIIDENTILAENNNNSTFETYMLRAKAVNEEISLAEFARVLLMINKKRGYKSSRKINSSEEGHLFDSMAITKELYEKKLTPGEYCLALIEKGARRMPEFYGSDLENEFERIWNFQAQFYPQYLTDEFKEKSTTFFSKALNKVFYAKYKITTADNKGKDKKLNEYKWRSEGLRQKLDIEHVAYVLSSISSEISSASGYLGNISDRSKELFFSHRTVGQFLYDGIKENPHFSVKNKVFYRQDYIDEFNTIWDCQAKFHKELNDDLKTEIRDRIIFYQRRLKSQKSLISLCEFEKFNIEVEENGQKKSKTVGCKVAPVSSPVFQEFRMWQKINNLEIRNRATNEVIVLDLEQKHQLADILLYEQKMSANDIIKCIFQDKPQYYKVNFEQIEGNGTIAVFFDKFKEICSATGHDAIERQHLGIFGFKDSIKDIFNALGYNTEILDFNTQLSKEEYEQQPLFKLWHLLYSYEGDNSKTGNESLIRKICEITAMPEEYAKILASITFKQDYGSLSHKAMRKILPFLKEGYTYSDACEKAGYRHSAKSLTKEEIANKVLADNLELIKMNELRNPVVEKILNQMINVVNSITAKYGKPDEINIELARELKSSKEERKDATESIKKNTEDNASIVNTLSKDPYNLSYVSKNDIVRYKLYKELEFNGYKTLYSNRYIPAEKLFSKEIDIEHIIPQSVLFNDSFSNKTLEYREINLEKDKDTAYDFVKKKYGDEELEKYVARVNDAANSKQISNSKKDNLLRTSEDIPTGFINRDLKETQYITKKAKEMLEDYVRTVVVTTGSITGKLREDWELVDVMKELNMSIYDSLDMTYYVTDRNGKNIKKIKDWSKRDDHRHHAMDAITIAFTKPSHIQYLNNLNARSDKSSSIYAIFKKETTLSGTKRVFTPPMEIKLFRSEVKRHLGNILVSSKAKNKVMTRNTNKIKKAGGVISQECLTPRGPLHKDQIYGARIKQEIIEIAVGAKMTLEVIETVASVNERKALLARITEFNGDAKKAFTGKNSIDKNPVWLDNEHTIKLESPVKCVSKKQFFTIRKSVDKDLKVEKVIDAKIRKLLEDRIARYGDQKKAFANLDTDPIWLNKEKGICVKRVAIAENMKLNSLHLKNNNLGETIIGNDNKPIPSDYINYNNNHHCAIYIDSDGNLQENMVTFYEAVRRKGLGLPVVDTSYKEDEGWKFMFTMKNGEMFVFPNEATGFDPNEIDLTDPANYAAVSPNLFRVQKLSSRNYYFRHHLDTSSEYPKSLQDITWKRIQSTNGLKNIVKVRIDHLGKIVSVGKYD